MTMANGQERRKKRQEPGLDPIVQQGVEALGRLFQGLNFFSDGQQASPVIPPIQSGLGQTSRTQGPGLRMSQSGRTVDQPPLDIGSLSQLSMPFVPQGMVSDVPASIGPGATPSGPRSDRGTGGLTGLGDFLGQLLGLGADGQQPSKLPSQPASQQPGAPGEQADSFDFEGLFTRAQGGGLTPQEVTRIQLRINEAVRQAAQATGAEDLAGAQAAEAEAQILQNILAVNTENLPFKEDTFSENDLLRLVAPQLVSQLFREDDIARQEQLRQEQQSQQQLQRQQAAGLASELFPGLVPEGLIEEGIDPNLLPILLSIIRFRADQERQQQQPGRPAPTVFFR